MKKMKKGFLGLLLVALSVVLVACSSGPKGTYKGTAMGADVTLTVDGKKGTMTSEYTAAKSISKGLSSMLGTDDSSDDDSSDSSSTEELTIDAGKKTMTNSRGVTYEYTQDGDTLTLTSSGLTVKLTKEK